MENIPKYYNYTFCGLTIDPYRILKLYEITDPALQHAIKKLLRCGRNHKDVKTDVIESIHALERFLTMLNEEELTK